MKKQISKILIFLFIFLNINNIYADDAIIATNKDYWGKFQSSYALVGNNKPTSALGYFFRKGKIDNYEGTEVGNFANYLDLRNNQHLYGGMSIIESNEAIGIAKTTLDVNTDISACSVSIAGYSLYDTGSTDEPIDLNNISKVNFTAEVRKTSGYGRNSCGRYTTTEDIYFFKINGSLVYTFGGTSPGNNFKWIKKTYNGDQNKIIKKEYLDYTGSILPASPDDYYHFHSGFYHFISIGNSIFGVDIGANKFHGIQWKIVNNKIKKRIFNYDLDLPNGFNISKYEIVYVKKNDTFIISMKNSNNEVIVNSCSNDGNGIVCKNENVENLYVFYNNTTNYGYKTFKYKSPYNAKEGWRQAILILGIDKDNTGGDYYYHKDDKIYSDTISNDDTTGGGNSGTGTGTGTTGTGSDTNNNNGLTNDGLWSGITNWFDNKFEKGFGAIDRIGSAEQGIEDIGGGFSNFGNKNQKSDLYIKGSGELNLTDRQKDILSSFKLKKDFVQGSAIFAFMNLIKYILYTILLLGIIGAIISLFYNKD